MVETQIKYEGYILQQVRDADRLQSLATMAPSAYGAFVELNHAAFKDGDLTAGFKELIAVGCR